MNSCNKADNMSASDVKAKDKDIRNYITKCFKDAFIAEGRECDEKRWQLKYVYIKNKLGIWQLLPIVFVCGYSRVQSKVTYRLRNNLMKNFGIIFGSSDDLRYMTYESNVCNADNHRHAEIDFNYTEAMFKVNVKNIAKYISLSIFDCDIDDVPKGECIPAYRFEKLLFQYYGMSAETYRMLDDHDERKHLPDDFNHDWLAYWDLYYQTFGVYPGDEYEIVCGPGVDRIIGREVDCGNEKPV